VVQVGAAVGCFVPFAENAKEKGPGISPQPLEFAVVGRAGLEPATNGLKESDFTKIVF